MHGNTVSTTCFAVIVVNVKNSGSLEVVTTQMMEQVWMSKASKGKSSWREELSCGDSPAPSAPSLVLDAVISLSASCPSLLALPWLISATQGAIHCWGLVGSRPRASSPEKLESWCNWWELRDGRIKQSWRIPIWAGVKDVFLEDIFWHSIMLVLVEEKISSSFRVLKKMSVMWLYFANYHYTYSTGKDCKGRKYTIYNVLFKSLALRCTLVLHTSQMRHKICGIITEKNQLFSYCSQSNSTFLYFFKGQNLLL